MSKDARYSQAKGTPVDGQGWTHGMQWPKKAEREAPPAWNVTGERQSITMRSKASWNRHALGPCALPEALTASAADKAARLATLDRTIARIKAERKSRTRRLQSTRADRSAVNLEKKLRKFRAKLQLRF